MFGIDLDRTIIYKTSSLRFFEEGEHHVTRLCPHDVLLLVYDGVLRFSEDGKAVEVHAGEYYIQRSGMYQRGESASSSPKYLYVHFSGEWRECERALAVRGKFDYAALSSLIARMDKLSHGNYSYTERMGVFCDILSELYRAGSRSDEPAALIRKYIEKNYLSISSLDDICQSFHYSKNHVINIFRDKYGITPFEYINDVKIRRAMYLLEVTSKSIDEIAAESGFNHYSHFYRLFMRKNGISPFEWRRRVRVLL